MIWFWVLGASAVAGVGLYLAARFARRWQVRQAASRQAEQRREFQRRREWLEARFLTLASRSGKPRGLSWVDCEFENPVAFARDRTTGDLRALVAVTIRFEAVEGGGMEDVEAVSNLRAATAVFRWHNQRWDTDGVAIFNLNPAEAIRHFQHELETVDGES